MNTKQRLTLTLIVISASFAPATTSIAGVSLMNHNETLLLDA